jgi:hypothetical protein
MSLKRWYNHTTIVLDRISKSPQWSSTLWFRWVIVRASGSSIIKAEASLDQIDGCEHTRTFKHQDVGRGIIANGQSNGVLTIG